MSATFHDLYSNLLNEVFLVRAREQLEQGVDGLVFADVYAEQGKPDFALAHLLMVDASDDVKRDILARSYERRADLTEEKAETFAQQFHRPFPLVMLEAQKDRLSASQVRQGKRVRRNMKSLNVQ